MTNPIAALIGLAGIVTGYLIGVSQPVDPRLEDMHVLRANAELTCKHHQEIIQEADSLLRDNDDSLITPSDIRKVVNDVVSRC